jgi:hypothetical protein
MRAALPRRGASARPREAGCSPAWLDRERRALTPLVAMAMAFCLGRPLLTIVPGARRSGSSHKIGKTDYLSEPSDLGSTFCR